MYWGRWDPHKYMCEFEPYKAGKYWAREMITRLGFGEFIVECNMETFPRFPSPYPPEMDSDNDKFHAGVKAEEKAWRNSGMSIIPKAVLKECEKEREE